MPNGPLHKVDCRVDTIALRKIKRNQIFYMYFLEYLMTGKISRKNRDVPDYRACVSSLRVGRVKNGVA